MIPILLLTKCVHVKKIQTEKLISAIAYIYMHINDFNDFKNIIYSQRVKNPPLQPNSTTELWAYFS